MRIRVLALGSLWAASLFGQARRFSWQDLCFKNPALPVCQGNDYAAGVKRFLLTVWIRNNLTSDVTLEFNGVPSPNALQMWQTKLGAATVEGNAVHVRTSMEADEVRQKFGPIAESPLGEGLAALVQAARYIPARDNTAPKQAKPIIYGLDSGPREVNQYPTR